MGIARDISKLFSADTSIITESEASTIYAPLNNATFTGNVNFTSASVIGIDALPNQSENENKYLTTNGVSASWATLDLSTKADKNLTIDQKTENYILSLSDNSKLIEMGSENSLIVTIPANSSVAFPIGSQITILRTSTGSVTIQGANGVLVTSTPGLNLRAQWSSVTLIKRATDSWVALGDLS